MLKYYFTFSSLSSKAEESEWCFIAFPALEGVVPKLSQTLKELFADLSTKRKKKRN